MQNALDRIRHIAREMKQMQRELFESRAGAVAPQLPLILNDPTAVETLAELKSAVDDLRRMLFFYIDEVAERAGGDPRRALQAYQLTRATELLQVLSQPSSLELTAEHRELLVESVESLLRQRYASDKST